MRLSYQGAAVLGIQPTAQSAQTLFKEFKTTRREIKVLNSPWDQGGPAISFNRSISGVIYNIHARFLDVDG
jgi:hypothetical protein